MKTFGILFNVLLALAAIAAGAWAVSSVMKNYRALNEPGEPRAQRPASPNKSVAAGKFPVTGEVCGGPGRRILPATGDAHDGTPATAWNLGKEESVDLPIPAGNIRASKYFALWMYLPSRVPDGHLNVSIRGRSDRMSLQWVGWRKVIIPVAAIAESPGTSLKEGTLQLAKGGAFPPDFTICYTAPEVLDSPQGPGLSDRDLLDHINLELPGMESVREAVTTGDLDASLKAIAEHFREGLSERLPIATPSNKQAAIGAAAPALRGEVVLGAGVSDQYAFPEGKIDWDFNPTKGNNFTNEFVWSMNRHGWWDTLAKTYLATKDDKYAAAWAGQLDSWVDQCPSPAIRFEGGNSAWRGLETGLRQSGVWPSVFFALAPSPGVPDSVIIKYLKSVVDHGSFLAGHPYGPGNHYLLAMVGLYTQGILFPEFRDAAFWRQAGFQKMSLSLERNTMPEGCWYEMSPGYHSWVVSRTLGALSAAKNNGGVSPSENALADRLQKMAEWPIKLAGPDGTVPTVNDGGQVKVEGGGAAAEVFPDSALIKWAAALKSDPSHAVPPPFTSLALPDSGYIVLRTGWKRDDSYVLMDAGPLGGWHGHQDSLNIVADFFGRHFVFDNGGYKYDKSDWRKYGPSTASHNTAMVDSLGQFRGFDAADPVGRNPQDTPAPLFGTNEKIDYASAWYVGDYGVKGHSKRIATHHREIGFLKPDGQRGPLLVVVDTFTPADKASHKYQVRWHIYTTKWQTAMNGRCIWTTDSSQPNLAVLSLDGADEFQADAGVKSPELLGWYYAGQSGGPTPSLTLRQSRSAAAPVRMVTVFVPFKGPAENPVLDARKDSPTSWTISIKGQPPLTLDFQSSQSSPSFSIAGIPWPQTQPQTTAQK